MSDRDNWNDGTSNGPVSGVNGSIQFATDGEHDSDGAKLFWDKTNNRLGIGNNSPSEALDVTGVVKVSDTLKTAKGADVASATALPLISDGNFVDVTGTTTITSFATVGAGTQYTLQFDGILILTHHATDLILPTGANITTAAGDIATFTEYATGDWVCTNYSRADGSALSGGSPTTYRDTKNSYFNESSTSKYFIPLAGSVLTSTSKYYERRLIPPNSGKLLKIRIAFTLPMGSTVFTLENSFSILGTKTQNIIAGVTEIDFTTGLDSGVNTFSTNSPLSISFNPTVGADQTSVTTEWEFDI